MNELRTLIDLCPGTRLPQHEEEIFSDNDLTEYYLHKLCEQCDWYSRSDSVPRMAYRYARYMMNSRWPEAAIITNPTMSYLYAYFVMKSRWPEAEAIIATDDVYREWYNNAFGTTI